MNKLMNADPKYDHIIDDEVVRISKEATMPMVFDSRMAWHFVEKSLKVFLIINPQIAAERVFGTRDSVVEAYASIDEAKNKLLERAKTENERYKQIYGVDNFKYENYDVIIDTSYIPPEKVASIIFEEYSNRKDGAKTSVYISPLNVYPTNLIDASAGGGEEGPVQIVKYNGNHFAIGGHSALVSALKEKKDIFVAQLSENNIAEDISLIKDNYPTALASIEEMTGVKYPSKPEL